MKRPKKYFHRSGMRFDRSHVQGPNAGFLGADIDVMVTTGSVERSVTQNPGTFHYDTVPFAGYPRNAGQMQLAFGGKGSWVDGYLLEEFDSGISSSFDPTHVLTGTLTDKISFRIPGFRGPADDYAIGFSPSGTVGNVPWFNGDATIGTGAYGLTSTSDLGLLWVARGYDTNTSALGGDSSGMFSKTTGVSGWLVKFAGLGSSGSYRLQGVFDGFGSVDLQGVSTKQDKWMVGLFVVERGVNFATLSVMDLDTLRVDSKGLDITALGDKSATGTGFKFGGQFVSVYPAQGTYSAFYIASGTNAMSGVVGNEATLLRGFAKVISAKDGFRFSGSAETDRSLGSFGVAQESQFITQHLLGLGTASLGRTRGYTTITTGSIPSWTNRHIRNSAFVITPFSSSDHESQVLNMRRSGSEGLEQSAIPASASVYVSKETRLSTYVAKKSASFTDTVLAPGKWVPQSFASMTGSLISVVSGVVDPDLTASLGNDSFQSSTPYFPASIFIDVPVSGKLVDIKVWVECIHLSGGPGDFHPMGLFGAALRSPNVTFGHAHPIRNDPDLIKVYTSDTTDYTALSSNNAVFKRYFYPPHPFYRDTYLLWEPVTYFNVAVTQAPASFGADGGFYSSRYPVWQRDRGIRTVFTDGASIQNPRHHYAVSPSGNYNGSPNSAVGSPSAYGNNVPWTSDATVFPATESYQAAGSPPNGWLSGPGGTADVNEWPTTGSNYGATHIRPLYPLLDSIYQIKRYTDDLSVQTGSATSQNLFQPDLWRGFRPGLRGTEVSGTWELMLVATTTSGSAYFRQARLEITYESDPWDKPNLGRAPRRKRPLRTAPVLLNSISGTDFAFGSSAYPYQRGGWDWFVSDNYTDADSESSVGRSFNLVLNTGTLNQNESALQYRLSGALGDASGSAPGWLLNNRFGMPWIPLSSASLVVAVPEAVASIHPQDILADRPGIDVSMRVTEAAQDVNPPKTRAARYLEVISSLTASDE